LVSASESISASASESASASPSASESTSEPDSASPSGYSPPVPAEPSSQQPKARARLATALAAILLLLLLAAFAFQRISDIDTGWLMALGRAVARGPFPRTNTLAWTAPDFPWYPTNWLFDLALYGSERLLGEAGPQWLTFVLSSAALLLAARAAQRAGASAPAALSAALLAVAPLAYRIVPRPHLVEHLGEALVTLAWANALAMRRARSLWPLVALFVVWENCHQSGPIGWAFLALFAAPALLGHEGFPPGERWRVAAALALCLLAQVVTPGGDANLRDLFAHWNIGALLPLSEHQPATLAAEPFLAVFGGGALVCALAVPESRRRWLAGVLLSLVLTFGLGRRFCGDLAMLSVVPMALAFDRIGMLLRRQAQFGQFGSLDHASIDVELTAADLPGLTKLSDFVRRARNKSWFGRLVRPRIVIALPSGMTKVDRHAVCKTARSAGAREVYLIEPPAAGANSGTAPSRARALWMPLLSLLCALGLLSLGRVPLAHLGSFWGTGWDPAAQPVSAVAELERRGLSSRHGFHSIAFGGYVAWRLPEAGTFQDGRVRAWPESFWRELVRACQSPAAFAALLDRTGAQWALVAVRPGSLSGHGLLSGDPRWRRVYDDDVAELFLRAGTDRQ
jgi:hypothetical protein